MGAYFVFTVRENRIKVQLRITTKTLMYFKSLMFIETQNFFRYIAFLESEEFYRCQIRIPRTFLPPKGVVLGKNEIFTTFHFNTQYAFPESGKHLFALSNYQF